MTSVRFFSPSFSLRCASTRRSSQTGFKSVTPAPPGGGTRRDEASPSHGEPAGLAAAPPPPRLTPLTDTTRRDGRVGCESVTRVPFSASVF